MMIVVIAVISGNHSMTFLLLPLIFYLLISAILPENTPLGTLAERAGLSIILALIFFLAEMAFGIDEIPLIIATPLILVLALLAHIRRRAVPRRRRFAAFYSYGLKSSREHRIPQQLIAAVFLLLVLSVISVGYMTLKKERSGYTEFYVTGLDVMSDGNATATVGVINHEKMPMNYTVAVKVDERIAVQKNVDLEDCTAYEDTLRWQINRSEDGSGKNHTLEILLYRGDDKTPYKAYSKMVVLNDYTAAASPEYNLSVSNESEMRFNASANDTLKAPGNESESANRSSYVSRSSSRAASGGGGSTSSSTTESSVKSGAVEEEMESIPETGSEEGNKTASDEMIVSGQIAEDHNVSAEDTSTNASTNATNPKLASAALSSMVFESLNLSPNQSLRLLNVSGRYDRENKTDDRENKTGENVPPVLESISPDKESPQKTGTNIIWSVKASDPEDDILYRFFLNGKPVTGWTASRNWSWYTSGIPAGDYNISVCVKDGMHGDCDDKAWALFTLLPSNLPPKVIGIESDAEGVLSQGMRVRWSALASDEEKDRLLYKFYLDGVAIVDWSTSGTFEMDTSRMSAGNHTLRVHVRDGMHAGADGYDDEMEKSFEIEAANAPPKILSLSPNINGPQPVGSEIRWNVSATDPDNDTILYRFSVDGNAVSEWQPIPRYLLDTSGYPPGNHTFRVRVKDAHHGESDDEMERIFELKLENSPPRVLSLLPDLEGPYAAGSTVRWSALASDPDNDPILYRFSVDGNAVSDWTSSAVFEMKASRMSAGNHTLRVHVRDGMHAGADGYDGAMEKSFEIKAANAPPKILSLTPDIAGPQPVGSEIRWSVSATDPDNDTILYRFTLNGRAVTDWSLSNTWTWNTSGLSKGEYTIGVWVRDGYHAAPTGFDSSQTARFVLTQKNQPPERIALIPDVPGPYKPGSEVRWRAEATDPDGDLLMYRFFLDGVPLGDWSDKSQVILNVGEAGMHNITASVSDGIHTKNISSTFNVEDERIKNMPPVIEDLTPDLSSPQHAGISVVWTAIARDTENDQILYRFLIDGTPAGEWSAGSSFKWNTAGVQAGEHNITVLVRDGKHSNDYDDSLSRVYTIRSIVDEALNRIDASSSGSASLGSKNITSVRVGR